MLVSVYVVGKENPITVKVGTGLYDLYNEAKVVGALHFRDINGLLTIIPFGQVTHMIAVT